MIGRALNPRDPPTRVSGVRRVWAVTLRYSRTVTELALELHSLDDLELHTDNEKGHSIETIIASMKRFGFTSPIEQDDRTGKIAAGHGRAKALIALRDLGEEPPDGIVVEEETWWVPVVVGWSSKNNAEATAHRIADNQTTIAGGWDGAKLAASLKKISSGPGLVGVGFDRDTVDRMMKSLLQTPVDAPIDPDSFEPPVTPKARAKDGDLWQLGPHRLICGDCRDPEVVDRLMGGGQINLAFTSPPYAEQRDYDVKSKFKPVPPDQYVEWFAAVAENVAHYLVDDGSWFVNIKPSAEGLDTDLYVFDLVLAHVRQWGWHFATEYCWERNGVPKSVTRRFRNSFEPIYQFARDEWKMRPEAVRHPSLNVPVAKGKGAGNTSRKGRQGNGGMGGALSFGPQRGQPRTHKPKENATWTPEESATYWNRNATGHPAAFPVGLPRFFVKAYTDEGDSVYDPFMGSGSTLLAAHVENRISFGCEISAEYVDLILLRFEQFTGIAPVKVRK